MSQPEPRHDYRTLAAASNDPRTIEELTEHYLLERRLARRLMSAGPAQRRHLYKDVYSELFASLPHHPQNTRYFGRDDHVALQSRLLRTLVPRDAVFVEIGAGDARLSADMAGFCRAVVAIDVTADLFDPAKAPANLQFLLTDGATFDQPDGSVDFVYSNQLMEHLHPEDADRQLAEIRRILKPGGRYLCVTPNINSGPHDISKYFDRRATGFHLEEYSFASLAAAMRLAGFRQATPLFVRKGRAWPIPLAAAVAIERLLPAFESATGRSVRHHGKVLTLLGVTMLATK